MPVQIGQKPESGFNNPLGLLSDCHRRIERFLDVLVRLCAKSAGDFMTPPKIIALEEALQYFREYAPKHTADEEESLFPRLRKASGGQAALKCMEKLESDHETAARDHGAVDVLGTGWIERGCLRDVELLEMKQALQRLSHLYARHIAIEDQQLFPLAARVLPAEALAEVGREMAARRGVVANRGT
jgi:hemerythrin-like domain-containing protein